MTKHVKLGILFVILLLPLFWFTSSAWIAWRQYSHLTCQIASSPVEWKVVELKPDVYAIEGHYNFKLNGQTYEGNTLFSEMSYRNPWAGEQAIKNFYSKLEAKVWYNCENPSTSSLQKSFPFKEWIYAALIWGILLYFASLAWYFLRRN